jgi:hypothetical protein
VFMGLMQGMKLLPTGRKSTMYLVLYGSMVGLGTVVLNYIGGFLATALQELGFGENMFNPVRFPTFTLQSLNRLICGMLTALLLARNLYSTVQLLGLVYLWC